MSHATKAAGSAWNVIVSLSDWPSRVPDRLSKTSSSHRSTHMSLKIQKKIIHFDQMIAGLRQRRWS